MTAPFFARLSAYFSKVGEVLRGQADLAAVFSNPSDVGLFRERIYAEFLRQHIPANCTLSLGGYLFGMDGSESAQLDILVINNKAPRFDFLNSDGSGKSFAAVDGCVAVASLKSKLDKHTLYDALANIATIPKTLPLEGRVNPMVKLTGYEDWPYKVVYAPNGVSLESALDAINAFYSENSHIAVHRRPNTIHAAGHYVIIRVGKNARTRDGTQIPENSFYGQPDQRDVYALFSVILDIQNRAQASEALIYHYTDLLNHIPI